MGNRSSEMGASAYRRARAQVLAASDMCAICRHGGALSADHIISAKDWPKDVEGKRLPGFNDPSNLQPAHGTMGARPPHNPCPTCGRYCNQSKGSRTFIPGRKPW